MGATKGETTAIRIRGTYERELAPGDTVFDQGDPGDQLYVIQFGEIELTRDGAGKARVVARLGPGDFFGELGVVLGKPRSTRAVAVRPTRVLELDRETLEAMCLEQPSIAIRLLRVVVARLIEAEHRLAMLGVDDLLRPVVRGLLRRAEDDEGGGMRIPTTLRRLSEDAGLSMFETHRALHQLIDRKLVRLVDDCLYTSDVEALSACLEGVD
ncbi:MAG: Crp/Fnr family transcriptional regulator [Myxococcota bacterium]